eukprot:365402-Chlamydomonas_euryale.AAC.4
MAAVFSYAAGTATAIATAGTRPASAAAIVAAAAAAAARFPANAGAAVLHSDVTDTTATAAYQVMCMCAGGMHGSARHALNCKLPARAVCRTAGSVALAGGARLPLPPSLPPAAAVVRRPARTPTRSRWRSPRAARWLRPTPTDHPHLILPADSGNPPRPLHPALRGSCTRGSPDMIAADLEIGPGVRKRVLDISDRRKELLLRGPNCNFGRADLVFRQLG